MLLGGGYYGQRLNKIYRGLSKVSRSLALRSELNLPCPISTLLRERDGTRNSCHSQADDQTVCSREVRWRTLWRFRDTRWLHISYDGGKSMVRGHGRRGTTSRDCRMICCALMHPLYVFYLSTECTTHRGYSFALHIDHRARVVTGIVVHGLQPLQTGTPLRFTH